jgi:capsular polysaccharide export protein
VNILILQGPLGPFFADLHDQLKRIGAVTHRVCFNKGDLHYAKADHVASFHGAADDWANWLADYIQQHSITVVVCYGDSRFYHREASEVCRANGIVFFALEEGYIRPGFVTCEEGGNNANSLFPTRFKNADLIASAASKPAKIGAVFRFQFWFATMYYIVKDWRFSGYWRYRHHRRGNWFHEITAWLIAGFRKYISIGPREKVLTDRLVAAHSGRMFIVPLQVAVDTQMIYHSRFDHVRDFIQEVITSFAAHAPSGAHLVIKHHPMDRGYNHYGSHIKKLARRLGCANRITYLFDADLEKLLAHSAGCVTVNSTVAMQALSQGTPTITLGRSMFADAGLAVDGSGVGEAVLDGFWLSPMPVDEGNVSAFRTSLIASTQVPGSFYRNRMIAAQNIAEKIRTRA